MALERPVSAANRSRARRASATLRRMAPSAAARSSPAAAKPGHRRLVAGRRGDRAPRPGNRRDGRPRSRPGRVSSRRADQSRSDRSWPRASSSVASPPSRTTIRPSSAPSMARSGHPGVVGRCALDEPAVALAAGELAVADDDRARGSGRRRCRPGRSGPRSTSSRRPCGGSWPRSCACGAGRRRRGRRRTPTAIAPFRGYIPNIRAGAVETISTQRSRLIRPPTTPPSWSRSSRSSTPGRPLGILRKSPSPELLLAVEVERAVVGRRRPGGRP